MIDIYHSRRDKFKKCLLYGKCENGKLETYVLNAKPKALFYARESSNRQLQVNQFANSFVANKQTITLETVDHIDVVEGNIILYLGHAWVVDAVSQELHLKETEFSNENHYRTFINIRR